jgi:hypothetical protein
VQVFFATDGEKFIRVSETPGIEVRDGNASVGVELQENKGGAVNLIFVTAQGFAEGTREVGFTSSELAVKGDDKPGREVAGELIGELLRIGFAVAVEAELFGHVPVVSGDTDGLFGVLVTAAGVLDLGVSGSLTLKKTSSRPEELL